VGDPSKPEERKMLEAQSPLNSAGKIVAPLLLVQGANDPGVERSESDRIVVSLRNRKRPVEYLVAPEGRQDFEGREDRVAIYAAMERFLARHIGGRYQASVPPGVKKSLERMTVDVKSLVLPGSTSADASFPPAPLAQFRPSLISAGRQKYVTRFTVMGENNVVTTVRTISAARVHGKKIWRVADVTTGGKAAGTDTVDIDASTSCTLHRVAHQGSGILDLDFGPEGVSGGMQYSRKLTPVEVRFSGQLVSDNAGIDVALCTLPLRTGYRSTLNMFDTSIWKVRLMNVSVTGKEKITTGAGAFDTFVVEVRPADGGNGNLKYWIANGPTRIIRNDSEIPPSMGGGTVTTEIAK
jgi:hypothetical protein